MKTKFAIMDELNCEIDENVDPNITKDDIHLIAKRLKFEFFKEEENIFAYGEEGDKFYVMLEGRAKALVPIEEKINSE